MTSRLNPVARAALVACAAALLASCDMADQWFGKRPDPPLPGERISVLDQASSLTPDAPDRKVVLPRPDTVPDWPGAGGFPPHAMWHLAMGGTIQRVWTADVGEGGAKRRAFLTQPIVAGGRVFAMDAESNLSAFDLKNGARFWHVDLASKDADEGSYGGGLAYDGGRLFATTSFGEIVSVDPGSGKVIWRKALPAPVRGAPTARAGRLIMVTVTNETVALAEDDGRELWTQNGVEEETKLMGGTSPAVWGNTVVVPYTSGELYALRIENGTQLWSESLSGLKRTNQVSTLTDIRGLPVVDKGHVYAAGNSDLLVAVDLATGRRLWDREVGSVQTPWVAGNFLYLITNAPAVVCFRADTGQVVWVTPLGTWEDPDDKKHRIVWTGPLLASDRLIVAASTGMAYSISPYTGRIMGQVELPDGVTIAPILADKTLIFVTDAGELVAYR